MQNIGEHTAQQYDAAKEYRQNGDCLALSPVTFGKPGPYVTSDMQFAQQFVDVIRWSQRSSATGGELSLDPDYAATIGTRFFVYEEKLAGSDTQQSEMVASELHVDYGEFFQEAMMKDEIRVFKEEPLKGQHHGHRFEGMFIDDDYVELKDYVLSSVLFDDQGYYAGLKFVDFLTKEDLLDQPEREQNNVFEFEE